MNNSTLNDSLQKHIYLNSVIFLFAGLLLISTASAQVWHHFGCDNSFTAYNPLETELTATTVTQLERIWGIGCDDGYFSVFSRSPALWNSRLYSTGAGAPLQCYDAKNGELFWTFGGTQTGWSPQPTVTSTGKVLYLTADSTNYSLFCVDGVSGLEIWEAPLQFNLGFSDTNVVVVDETRELAIIVANPFEPGEGQLYALNLNTGAIEWYMSKALNGVAFEGDFPILDGDVLYVRVTQESWSIERIGVIDLETQSVLSIWDKPSSITPDRIRYITQCGNRLAVVFSNYEEDGSHLVVYDTATGSIEWQYTVPHFVTGAIAYNPVLDRMYIPTNPRLLALDMEQTTGDVTTAWTYTGYAPIFAPSIANGLIWFISDTNAYVLDETDQSVLMTFPLGESGYESTQVAVMDGMAYFSGNGGTCDLFAYGIPVPCDTLGVSLYMPSHHFEFPDECFCNVDLCNPGTETLSNTPLFVILDVYGSYYFAPGFSAYEHYTVDLTPGDSSVTVLPEFTWPPGTGSADNIIWYAAMTDSAVTGLLGEMDTWTFGWD